MRKNLPIAPTGRPIVPAKVDWMAAEFLKTRLAHGYCSRHLTAGACPYANICETCDNFVPGPEHLPILHDQLADIRQLHADAQQRGWIDESKRHSRIIDALETHCHRLETQPAPCRDQDGRLIEHTFGGTCRRIKVIGRLPGETSCLSLVWAVLDRASAGWRGFTLTPAGLRLLQGGLVGPPAGADAPAVAGQRRGEVLHDVPWRGQGQAVDDGCGGLWFFLVRHTAEVPETSPLGGLPPPARDQIVTSPAACGGSRRQRAGQLPELVLSVSSHLVNPNSPAETRLGQAQ
ncbi:MAG TPA: hypothetical protein VFM54_17115 [Micromonosporaceae bacterium]|nr:hypothetical protein [Micromonosporaceae bacterium]